MGHASLACPSVNAIDFHWFSLISFSLFSLISNWISLFFNRCSLILHRFSLIFMDCACICEMSAISLIFDTVHWFLAVWYLLPPGLQCWSEGFELVLASASGIKYSFRRRFACSVLSCRRQREEPFCADPVQLIYRAFSMVSHRRSCKKLACEGSVSN